MSVTFLGGPKVKLSYSADAWQLYNDSDGEEKLYRDNGREEVAEALNRGMEERIAAAATRKDFKLGKLLNDYSKFGAADTEGEDMVENILDKVYGNGGSW